MCDVMESFWTEQHSHSLYSCKNVIYSKSISQVSVIKHNLRISSHTIVTLQYRVCLKHVTYKWISAREPRDDLHRCAEPSLRSSRCFFHSLSRAQAIRVPHRSLLFKFAWGNLQNLHLDASQTLKAVIFHPGYQQEETPYFTRRQSPGPAVSAHRPH